MSIRFCQSYHFPSRSLTKSTNLIRHHSSPSILNPSKSVIKTGRLAPRANSSNKANMSQLAEIASKLFGANNEYKPKIVPVEKRIRGILGGKVIFDTTSAKLVWEQIWFPQYWIPRSSFQSSITFTADKPISGVESSTYEITGGNNKTAACLLVPDSLNSELAGLVKIDFNALDQWLEEMSQIVYHPKDPFHRVDILPSGRHVKIEIDGEVLADTTDQGGIMSLWETGFPGRWYLPRTAISWTYLTPSQNHTGCPYKGEASYYNAVINGTEYKDVVWWYKSPTMESAPIIGMLCFYPDKVDMWVDGKKSEKAGVPFQKEMRNRE